MPFSHYFFIPTIFFLGFFIGSAISNFLSQKKIGEREIKSTPKTKVSLLAATFAVFITFFIITHMIPFSGGAKSLHAVLGHQSLFDQRASSSADEVYDRLESFGEVGRSAYKKFAFSGDVVFPLSLLVFLIALAFFVKERTSLSRVSHQVLISLPIFWFLSDMIENSVIYYLISQYPERNIFLAHQLGSVTNLKFTLLLASIGVPSMLYALFRNKFLNGIITSEKNSYNAGKQ